MADATVQLVGLALSGVGAIISFLVGLLVNSYRKKIDECVADTKAGNESISSLATKAAVTDTTVQMINRRLDIIGTRTHELVQRMTILETRDKVARGDD